MKNNFPYKSITRYMILLLIFYFQNTFSQTSSTNYPNDSVKALVITYDIIYPNGKPSVNKKIWYDKLTTFIYKNNIIYVSSGENSDTHIVMSNDYGVNSYTLLPNLQLMLKFNRNDEIKIPGVSITMSVIKTKETKNILGFECIQNEIHSNVRASNLNISATNYVYSYEKNEKYNFEYFNKDIKGLYLGENKNLGIENKIQICTAKTISEQLVDSSLFKIPDYKCMTMEEYTNKITNDKNFSAQLSKELGIEELKIEDPINKPKLSKWKQIFNIALDVLNGVNDVMNNTNRINMSNQSYDDACHSNVKSSNNYQIQYNICDRNAQSNYSTLRNALNRKTDSTNEMLINQCKRYLSQAQDKMRNIRSEAAKNGVSIAPSKYENISY